MNKKVISSILSLAMCGSLVTGATYALFTSESETNIAINSGKVQMVAKLDNLKTFSAVAKEGNDGYESVEQASGKFLNEGTAVIEKGTLTLDRMTPGDSATFDIVLTNESNVAIQYQTLIKSVADSGLFSGLVITVEEATFTGTTVVSEWTALKANAQPDDNVISVSVELPIGANNEYQETSTELAVNVNAVQGNAIVEEVDPEVTYLYSAADLISFEKSVNEGKNNYLGKTVKMMDTIDLKNIPFTPIGQTGSTIFMGNFDGNGYAIKNLNIAVTGADDAGLFGWYAAANDTSISISNLTIEHATVTGEERVGVIVGYLDPNVGDVTIDKCQVKNVSVSGARAGAIAGFVGTSGASPTAVPTISNCLIEGATVAAYKSKGEVVGYSYTNYVQTNVTVNDVELKTIYVVNDVAQLDTNIKNTQDGDIISLGETTFTFPHSGDAAAAMVGKELTFAGTENSVIDISHQVGVNGSTDLKGTTLTFDGVTVKWSNANEGHQGFKNPKKVIYKNCTIIGTQFMYSGADFINCTFITPETADGYCVYTRAGGDYTFTDCTFKTGGRAIMMYNDDPITVSVTLTNCKFYDGGTYSSEKPKAAVETGDNGNGTKASVFNIYINNCVAVEGFEENNSTSNLWGNKDNMPKDRLNVVLDGVDVY